MGTQGARMKKRWGMDGASRGGSEERRRIEQWHGDAQSDSY